MSEPCTGLIEIHVRPSIEDQMLTILTKVLKENRNMIYSNEVDDFNNLFMQTLQESYGLNQVNLGGNYNDVIFAIRTFINKYFKDSSDDKIIDLTIDDKPQKVFDYIFFRLRSEKVDKLESLKGMINNLKSAIVTTYESDYPKTSFSSMVFKLDE